MTAQERLARIDKICAEIREQMAKPALRELTSLEMRQRANRLRDYANTARGVGVEVRPEYRSLELGPDDERRLDCEDGHRPCYCAGRKECHDCGKELNEDNK